MRGIKNKEGTHVKSLSRVSITQASALRTNGLGKDCFSRAGTPSDIEEFSDQRRREKPMTVESNLHTAVKPLEQSETHLLIGSDKVAGTAVYSSDGQKKGRIERVMIGKYTGKVDYAVMSLGGFMGLGEDYYP